MMNYSENKHNGFGIPNDYFNHLQDAILQEVETLALEKEIKIQCGAAHGFKIEDSYFNELEQIILKRKRTPVFTLQRIGVLSLGIAASVMLLISITSFFNSSESRLSQQTFEEMLKEIDLTDENMELLTYDDLSEILVEIENEEIEDEELLFLFEDNTLLDEFPETYLEI